MQRNWDCVRAILLEVESLGDTNGVLVSSGVQGYDPDMVSYHICMMIEAGLVVGACGRLAPLDCWANRLTWEGHEFLDKVRSATAWNKIKGVAQEKGLSLSFDVIKLAATHVIAAIFN